MKLDNNICPKRAVELIRNAELVSKARTRVMVQIAQGCRVHEQYLAEFGSLADALRTSADGA